MLFKVDKYIVSRHYVQILSKYVDVKKNKLYTLKFNMVHSDGRMMLDNRLVIKQRQEYNRYGDYFYGNLKFRSKIP